MVGGTGNDVYSVDNFGDVVVEGFGEGIDTIRSSISLSLNVAGRFDVENLTLAGGAVVGVGNGLGNQIVGNNLANTLSGLAGNDSLFGLGGNDNMFGGIGNDLLNGGLGADTMRGELGNDTYVVDNAGDVVIDFGAGIDRIVSSISTSLNIAGRLTVENLTLTERLSPASATAWATRSSATVSPTSSVAWAGTTPSSVLAATTICSAESATIAEWRARCGHHARRTRQ